MSEKANRKLVNIISNASDQADIDASLESNANARQLENHFYLDYQDKIKGVKQFLQLEYAYYYHKANKCLLNRCYNNIYVQPESVRTCVQECLSDAQPKSDQMMEMMHDEFAQCVRSSSQSKFFIQNVFTCYDTLSKKLDSLPFNLRTDFSAL